MQIHIHHPLKKCEKSYIENDVDMTSKTLKNRDQTNVNVLQHVQYKARKKIVIKTIKTEHKPSSFKIHEHHLQNKVAIVL